MSRPRTSSWRPALRRTGTSLAASGCHRSHLTAHLFCRARRPGLTPVACPDPPHLDAVDHHPYGIGGPLWHAFNADDVAVPDIYKIARVLHAAERAGHVLPRGPKALWATEISWDSSPPDPNGVPIAEHARWVEQAMYVLWSQGVSTVLWLQIVDAPPIPDYASSYQAGMYYLNGAAKPAAQAFAFPFVTKRLNRNHVQAWGRAPIAGKLAIEVLRGRRWVVERRLAVKAVKSFLLTLPIRGARVIRAQVGPQTSLTWSQGRMSGRRANRGRRQLSHHPARIYGQWSR